MGNSAVFPAPEEHRIPSKMKEVLYFHTKIRDDDVSSNRSRVPGFCCGDRKTPRKIPFLYFKEQTDPKRNKYLIIYFHGNSEVLSTTFKTLQKLHQALKVSMLSLINLTFFRIRFQYSLPSILGMDSMIVNHLQK